MNCCWCWRIW